MTDVNNEAGSHDTPYSLQEHRHRFAAWAAGRAAGRGNHSLTIAEAADLLENAKVRDFVENLGRDCVTSDQFDEQHRQWRERMIQRKGSGRPISHGGAAKIINVYLKSAYILGPEAAKEAANFIHPPIDDRLLKKLAKDRVGSEEWGKLKKGGWSNFSSDGYEDVIRAIRRVSGDKPLWMIEEYWSPHA